MRSDVMRQIKVTGEHYCEGCPLEELTIRQNVLYADNKRILEEDAVCVHAEYCNQLWNHLCDYYETHDDEDDDDEILDNDDWSFSPDAKYEDIHDL